MRNLEMAARIEQAPVRYPLRFVVAGDSGAWPDPTADGIFGQLLDQVTALDPPPLFFANLGDFAGPGTPDRHEHWGFEQREAEFLALLRETASRCGRARDRWHGRHLRPRPAGVRRRTGAGLLASANGCAGSSAQDVSV